MRILLTGTTGKVGGFLARHWQNRHEVIPLSRAVVDLSDSEALRAHLAAADFDLLVNPAAISTPEGCETDLKAAQKVNVEAPSAMAQACAEKERPFIHFSTDYVLDGDCAGFKNESAACFPNNNYGATKLAGEEAVLKHHPSALVARVSWVFGSAGDGFLEKVFRQIQEGAPLEGVADKYSMPTSASEMANALDFLLEKGEQGIFHITQTAEEPVSWHLYALEVAQAMHEQGLTPEVLPVTPRKMAEIPALRTNRPIHTAMSPTRLQALAYSMSPWQEALRERLRQLSRGDSSC